MTYYRKTDNAKAQIVEHSPVTNSVYVQFADEPPQIITWNEFIIRCRKTTDFRRWI